MKNPINIVSVFLLFAITACNHSVKTETKTSENEMKVMENVLYDFSLTTDPNYCNSDSIVGTDCGGGNFYFTKSGNVLYNFFCFGGDSTVYDIGKYSITDNKIVCTFNSSYSFYRGSDDGMEEQMEPIDPNKGEMKNIETWSTEIKRISCDKFEYSFVDRNEKYVLKKSDTESGKWFYDDFKKINAFQNL